MRRKNKIERESKILALMISIYCREKHKTRNELCNECKNLLEYALKKLQMCPFGENKPPCKKCNIHCYSKDKRTKIKEVMKFSGPRMLLYHPIEWLKHKI